MEKIIISEHAKKRSKSRANFKGNNLLHMAKKAYFKGLGFTNARGKILEFIKQKYHTEYRANNIKVYGRFVYIFRNNVLLTVIDLPQYLWGDWEEYKRAVM